mmetsp:Transcript_38139/g.89423  ORF Transcript_38139/g.89423 Transcript_38139/m.89423 type:complete len:655 (+) Transcript_38139:82-2046(+)|eukprot:CAMPEP_0178405270 /NCGR_PEP_ID=MMETSP0689_2-20121128/18313_1 /TAXON_ID=160604 /ORGANISM="Amphidinium massartii, Strain CS-259" /LENGTH=654 /DNA_ID=CAMNT_0020026281 /DNA_START=33 /DNA_END=1997 /DNA_ORIENTATION=-
MVDITLGTVNTDLSKDLFLSLRVSDVQKFAKVSATKGYKFPASAVADKKYGRLEVYRRIGSSNIAIDPAVVQGLHELVVPVEDPTMPNLTFRYEMRKVDASTLQEKPNKPDLSVKQQEVQEYLVKHQIEQQMLEAMQALLRERPDDPATFISQRLLSGAGKSTKVDDPAAQVPVPNAGDKMTAGSMNERLERVMQPLPSVDQAPSPKEKSNVAPVPPSESPPRLAAESSTGGEAVASEDDPKLRAVRARMEATLEAAAEDGRLMAALEGDESIEVLRQKTRGVFMEASQDGSLQSLLSAFAAAEEKPTEKESEEVAGVEDENKLRSQVRQTLAKATSDGSLVKSLEKVRGRPQSQEAITAPAVSQADLSSSSVEALRATTRSLLAKAIEDGTLEESLARIQAEREAEANQQGEMANVMELCREVLLSGADDGSLDAALEHAKSGMPQAADSKGVAEDPVWTEVRKALLDASDSGKLESVFVDIAARQADGQAPEVESADPREDDLRARCRDVLVKASVDGRLENALTEVAAAGDSSMPQESPNALREACRDILVQASLDGRLDSALEGVTQDRQSVRSLRAGCRDVLIKACEDGSLAAELGKIFVDKEQAEKPSSLLTTLTSEEAQVLRQENVELRRTIEDLKVAVQRLEERSR